MYFMKNELVSYLITDPQYYGNTPTLFEENLRKVLNQHTVNMACFRDKTSPNYVQLAHIFVKVCKEHGIEHILLNENLSLAKELNCGIHLTSNQFDCIKEAKEADLYTVISCHNILEIEKAQKSYVNAVTYSPIYATPNKPDPKGVQSLKKILSIFDMNIIALGGVISQKHVDEIARTKAYGFASIRYFL